MLTHSFLENSAIHHPNNVAVIHDDQRVNYHQLNAWADGLARHLLADGITKGDRIALLLGNGVEYVVSYYAALKVGAVAAPLNPALKPDSLKYLIDDLEPSAIITSFRSERLLRATDFSEKYLKLLIIKDSKQQWASASFKVSDYSSAISGNGTVGCAVDIDETDLASIIYTSGSTGKPKGVMLSHLNIVTNTNSICSYLNLSEDDIQMVVLPFFYVMGKSLLNTHIAAGGTVVINNRFMYPADVVNQMIEEKVTGFSGVPSTYAYLLNRSPLANSKDKLRHLRYCSQAGGHMAGALKLQLEKALPDRTKIVIMYGATEAAARLTYLEPSYFTSKMDSIGKPIPGVTIRILDEKGNDVPNGGEGEFVASGANIMPGYWRDSNSTAAVLDENGYHTGDIGYRDHDGFLYAIRRKDGLLKVGGHRVNPIEIEDFLMTTEMLIETAVVGLPDELLGVKLVAVVVPKEDPFESENLSACCAAKLPKHKCPSDIITLRTLPKNANGKIDRSQCKDLASKALCIVKA